MSFQETVVTLEELQQLDLAALFSEIKENTYTNIESAFTSKKDSPAAQLLAAACSMHFNPKDSRAPFSPKFVFEDRRGLIASDFSKESLTAIKDFCDQVENHELRARLADIAWITKSGSVEHAYMAIEAYLESAKELTQSSDSWVIPYERIERALRLSCFFRRENQRPDLFQSVSDYLLEEYEYHKGEVRSYYSLKLLSLCLECGINESNWIFDEATQLAAAALEVADFNLSISAYEVALDAANSLREKQKKIDTWEAISNCHEKAAEKGPTGMFAAGRLLKAVDALAKVPGTKDRRLALYEEMREQQIESLHDLNLMVSEPQDIRELVHNAVARVQSKDWFDALFRLGTIASPVQMQPLKEQALEQMRSSFAWMFGTTHMDHEGMTTAVIPASLGIEEDEKGLQCWSIMMRNIGIHHQLSVEGQIFPAMNEVSAKYNINELALEHICHNHPFIPDGHEEFFVKGLLAGFNRDFMTACHLLVPQIENSLRYLARQRGEEPSTLHGDGSQERSGIKALLGHQAIIDTLGSDITSNLQVILLDKMYGDLRNQLSHGYVPASNYWGTAPKYLWWLVLHILMLPLARHWKENYKVEESVE
ncbi:DUF4209 domain-containing protein [Shewanella sp. SR43-4]|uniref:DUF4209 domain-containing protein n=1 Tax=Shewanella sp. SR43-4 TaxID=2760942 RepID=UPI0015FAB8E5|nr:DUF4209 domain-containing protein [Shewanella sp. SR43-4]MBB1317010.1 DUF4209 domain-containing protein [Shewanella sp. SR43-4]